MELVRDYIHFWRGESENIKVFMDKSGVRFVVSRTPLTFVNMRVPEFDFGAC